MRHAVLLCAALAGTATAATTLEQELGARRPDVLRWETRPLESAPPAGAAVAKVGRIGVRTPVRFADGRLRWYVVAGFRPVLVTTQPLEHGAELRAELMQRAERDVIASACEPVELDAAHRWRAARRLAAGEALCVHNVAAAPDVERERPVTLSAQRGAVIVSRVLTAAADARAGERVRLRDRATGATLVAIVTGPGAARLSQEIR